MTAPLLPMSTGSSANQEMARNQAPLPRHDMPHRTIVRGRRATKTAAPRRPPQRGLGVAQLERLRQQEHWKNTTQMAQHLRGEFQIQSQFPSPPLGGAPLQYCPSDYCTATQPPVAFSDHDQMLGDGRGLAVQRVGDSPYRSDWVVGSLYMAGVGGSAFALKPSRELSSMPNVRCFPDRRDICVQKNNTINASRNVLVLDHGTGDRISNRERPVMNGNDFLALNLRNGFSRGRNFTSRDQCCAPHGGHQDVEVMRMGGKVNAAAGGDSLLMEYEFFPVPGRRKSSNNGRITSPKKLSFPAVEDGESASAFAVNNDSGGGGGGGGEASNKELNSNVDLSLRLSY